jgi:hypothetical protein
VGVDEKELVDLLRTLAIGLEESTGILIRIADLQRDAASLHGQLADAAVDLERMLKRLEATEESG